jgi:hypothetical protein
VARRGTARLRPWILAALLAGAGPGPAGAQVFLAARPDPSFTIGPLFVVAGVAPERGPVTVDVLWSLVTPPERSAAVAAQDLYLLWPSAVTGDPALGRPDPELARYVGGRGFGVIEEGRVPLLAQGFQQLGRDLPPEPIAGGAPFVTFVGQGGPLGLTAPATYLRIPANAKLGDRRWMMNLRLTIPDLVRPRKTSWLETLFGGPRHQISLSFSDVRSRALFPMYFENRDRVVHLAEEPSQLLVNFAHADRLKIDTVSPPSSHRRISETLENTEVVSQFLDPSEGLSPQVLTVEFGYLSGVQAWAPVLIPTLFFVLGNLAAVLVRTVADRLGKRLARRVRFGPPGPDGGSRPTGVVLSRETLARLVPGATTYRDVLRICGPEVEQLDQLAAPERRTLVYRGRRVVPQWRRTFGWLATVGAWIVEQHEVEIELERDVVTDVRARVRRSRLEHANPS